MALAALLVCFAGLLLIPKKGLRGFCALVVFYTPQTLVWWWMLDSLAESFPETSAIFYALSWIGLTILLGHRVLSYGTPWRGHRLEIIYVLPMHVFQNALLLQVIFWPIAVIFDFGANGQATIAAMPLLIGTFGLVGLKLPWRWVTHRAELRGLSDTLKVVHLSDLHFGPYFTQKQLERLALDIEERSPDLVAITGDFLTQTTLRRYQPILEFVSRLTNTGLSVVSCLGNHDLASAGPLTKELEMAGSVVLRNRGQTLQAGGNILWISGVDYFSGKQSEAQYRDAFEAGQPSENLPELLLCHDPRGFRFLPEDRDCLMLSGHLHGGQIGLEPLGINWNLLTPLGFFNPGWHRSGQAQMFLHAGTGTYGFPARIGTRTEAVVIELSPQSK
ncbi:MAG: metallophosphoesterase [Verrucomicrobiota bacterium]